MFIKKSSLPLVVLTIILLKNVEETLGAVFEPYKVTGDKEKKDAEAKFIEINRAYELLRYIIFYMMPIKFPNDVFCY